MNLGDWIAFAALGSTFLVVIVTFVRIWIPGRSACYCSPLYLGHDDFPCGPNSNCHDL